MDNNDYSNAPQDHTHQFDDQSDIQIPQPEPDVYEPTVIPTPDVESVDSVDDTEEPTRIVPLPNDKVTLKYAVPTAGVVVGEKGKDILSILLPQQSTTEVLKDPYWRNIISIFREYGTYWLDYTTDEKFNKLRNRIKGEFEAKFGRLFTDAEYVLAESIIVASELHYNSNFLGDVQEEPQFKEGSNWEQEFRDSRDVTYPFGATGKSVNVDFSTTPIDGNTAQAMLAERLGYGTNGTARLPNSGFTLKIANPSNNEFFMLEDNLNDDKITLGLDTLGYFFGANAQRVNTTVANFALSKIVSTNPRVEKNEDLKKYIKVTDLHALAIALATVMYPDGYPFSTPCAKCKKVIDHGLVKPSRLVFINNPAIPSGCKKIIEKKVVNLVDIEEYQSEIERNIKNNFHAIATDSIPFLVRFRIPTLLEMEQQGDLWLNQIEQLMSMDRTDLTEGQRKQRYEQHASLMTASEYLAYVDYIYVLDAQEMESDDYIAGRYEDLVNGGNPNRKLTDRLGILAQLNMISSDESTTLDFHNAIARYRESSHLYIVAVPEMLCDCVKGTMTAEEIEHHRKHPKLTPLDAISLFFTLRARRSTVSRVPVKQVKS